ncbi:MAG: FeoA family protein [bacterium]|nr:FeoA family protein [bacterium]
MKKIDLTQMKVGETGSVVEIRGGDGFVMRTQALGIREGKKIRKVSSQVWRGPVTIEIDNLKVAIGFGMAKRIMIEKEDGKDEANPFNG